MDYELLSDLPPHKHSFWKTNEDDFYKLHLKYGWLIEDFGPHMMHLRITITCVDESVSFDFWPSTGKLRSLTFGGPAVKTHNVEESILKWLKKMNKIPK